MVENNLKEQLTDLTKRPNGFLRFSDQQITFMLKNIGSADPVLRDQLVFTLFARGFDEKAFSLEQRKRIIDTFLQKKPIFFKIDEADQDAIFLRSFSALLGAVILQADARDSFLNDQQQLLLFQWPVIYLKEESDFRGFVPAKGWAHGIAHGSDFLAAALAHSACEFLDQEQIFSVITSILEKLRVPFIDDEEQRLANAFYQGLKSQNLTEDKMSDFIRETDRKLWQQLKENLVDLSADYRLSTWFKLLQNWYFMTGDYPQLQKELHRRIFNYYQKMGYEF